MEDFVARPSPWRITLLILGCASLVLMGLWLVGAFGPPPRSHRYSPVMMAIVGWASIALFGFFGLTWIRRLFDKRDRLRISAAGIRWIIWSDETIPWSEITDVTTWATNGQKFIILHLREPSRFPSHGVQAPFAGVTRKMTGGDIAVTLTGSDRTFDDAMAAVAMFRT